VDAVTRSRPETATGPSKGAPLRRVNVVGTTGSGKTTVAHALARLLGVPHIELDALFWKANWEDTPDEEFLPKVDRETDRSAWVLDGNYSRTRGIVWPKADTIVWLDYSFPRVFGQLLARTVRRALTKEPMWDGCVEDWRTAILSRKSILLWCLQTYWKRRRSYPKVFARPEHGHLTVVRLRNPRATRHWLEDLARDRTRCDESVRKNDHDASPQGSSRRHDR
jgi:adenylate kinase family enzyme